jgi:inorganic pyrophosphatase
MKKLEAFAEKDTVNVIIETPRGSRNKFAYDAKHGVFKLKKILPMGMAFPFDFGFIPGTKGQDGDPLDILVLMDEPAHTGCLVECRVIGALKAEQSEKNGKIVRNDRLIGVAALSELYKDKKHINDLDESIVSQIEHFFASAKEQENEKFEALGWVRGDKAIKLITDAGRK